MTPALRLSVSLGVICACTAVGSSAAKAPARESVHLQRIDVNLTGRMLDLVPDPHTEEVDSLLLLVANEPDEQSAANDNATIALWRLEFPAGAQNAISTLIRNDLPGKDGRIIANDRGDRVVLLPGRLVRIPPTGGSFTTLLSDAELHPRTSDVVPTPNGWQVSIPGMGRVRFVQIDPDGMSETPLEVKLPVSARLGRTALGLRTEVPRRFPDNGQMSPVWTTPPMAEGRQRLHGVHLDPLASPTSFEWWARLPQPEEVLEHVDVIVGGEPAVLVTTRRADKLSIFGEKRVRLFRMKADRGTTGHAPFFAAETGANLWQPITSRLLDVNADGHDDLVLAYWKGLIGAKLVLDVYLGDDAGSFASSPRTTSVDVKHADRSFMIYGDDLDGDARPDLALVGDGEFQIFRGSAANPRAKNLVSQRADARIRIRPKGDETPDIEVTVSSEGMDVEAESTDFGMIRLLDVGGDGRPEAVFARVDDGHWVFTLLRVER